MANGGCVGLFKFNKARKRLFIIFLTIFFCPLLLLYGRIIYIIPSVALFLFLPLLFINAIYIGGLYFIFSIIPGTTSAGSGPPGPGVLFHWAEFGPSPIGFSGWAATIIFYSVLSLLLSWWFGNLIRKS